MSHDSHNYNKSKPERITKSVYLFILQLRKLEDKETEQLAQGSQGYKLVVCSVRVIFLVQSINYQYFHFNAIIHFKYIQVLCLFFKELSWLSLASLRQLPLTFLFVWCFFPPDFFRVSEANSMKPLIWYLTQKPFHELLYQIRLP